MKQAVFKGYAVCIRNRGYPASLEPRKIYRVVRDAKAAAKGLLRVVDESGADYLYPSKYFAPIQLSPSLKRALSGRG